MPDRGKCIVIEGIDGSGKRTQLEMLVRAFDKRSLPHAQVTFPNYEGYFGKEVARFLNGEFGPLETVDPYFSALLYADDRLESKASMEAALAAGKNLLADRYIASNLAHQGARVAPERRARFLGWLRHLEYDIYGLPVEDLVIYLRLPVALALELIDKKRKREYTELRRDLQEADRAHLEAAAQVYEQLARQPNWATIECAEAAGTLRTPGVIQREILAAVDAKMLLAVKVAS